MLRQRNNTVLLTSRNKNTKKIEKLSKKAARNKASVKGEPMSNPLSFPEKISFTY